ncbi:MAG: ATPase [Candidatus Hydrogenedentota bacterium]|nr:MAG: ATPase [Candidatus Hydrogenedentota bacterium]
MSRHALRSPRELERLLARIDGRGYKAYRDLHGRYDFEDFLLSIDHVQSDPFASPSRVSVQIPFSRTGLPRETIEGTSRIVATEDFLLRSLVRNARKEESRSGRAGSGSGKSGRILVLEPGPALLKRSAVRIDAAQLEARFRVGLPAFGRRIAGEPARRLLLESLPRLIRSSLFYSSLDADALKRWADVSEDADALREALPRLGLVAFVADGAILPRASGIATDPLPASEAVPFASPESLRVSISTPHSGILSGMGVPRGVTLIVGGGYHGKSTLLNALMHGVYNHIPGDGRERVVTDSTAVKIRAEDGRSVRGVDISPFINNLPFRRDTTAFTTDDASGSTSQAASIIEAVEAGAEVLLIDEDTSATNFMIRDHRMQKLIRTEDEPITPFVDRVRQLFSARGVSTILVLGGSGDYLDVADTVIGLFQYRVRDLTPEAKRIAGENPTGRERECAEDFPEPRRRIPIRGGISARRGRHDAKIRARNRKEISFGRDEIDLSSVEQIVETAQTRAIGDAVHRATALMDGRRTMTEILDAVMAEAEKGLDYIALVKSGEYAAFRRQELAAAINRHRGLSTASR